MYVKSSNVSLRRIRLQALFTSAVLLVPWLTAQTTRKPSSKPLPPSAFQLVSIKVIGTKRYTPEEIITATGLQLGQTISEDDCKRVTQRLGETGAFSGVAYRYEYSPAGTKLELEVSDGDQFVPARFDNLVWFSDQELLDNLRARVPLFHGQLPLGGNLADQVSDALQALLIGRNVQGRAEYLRAALENGPIDSLVFSVTGPSIRVRNPEFAGAGASELPSLQALGKKLQGQDYSRNVIHVHADKEFLPVYLERGYLKAAFAEAQAKIVQESTQEVLVDVTVPVAPGRQYKLTQIQWSGNTVFPAAKLQPLLHLQAGQPANAVQLGDDLGAVRTLYGTRGYMVASIKSVPQMDDAQSTVSYQLEVREGDVYSMGDLEIQGLDDTTTARLAAAWKLRAGEAYDSSYLKRFLDEASKTFLLGQWNLSIHETPNITDKTVDVTLRFDPKPR